MSNSRPEYSFSCKILIGPACYLLELDWISAAFEWLNMQSPGRYRSDNVAVATLAQLRSRLGKMIKEGEMPDHRINRPPQESDPERIISGGFLDFATPVELEFTPWQQHIEKRAPKHWPFQSSLIVAQGCR